MIFDIKSPARMDLSRPAHDFSPRGMDLLVAERDVLSAGGDFWVGEVVFLGVEGVLRGVSGVLKLVCYKCGKGALHVCHYVDQD